MPEELRGSGPEALWHAVGRLIVAEGWTLRVVPPTTQRAYGSATWSEKIVRIRPDIDRLHQIKTGFHGASKASRVGNARVPRLRQPR